MEKTEIVQVNSTYDNENIVYDLKDFSNVESNKQETYIKKLYCKDEKEALVEFLYIYYETHIRNTKDKILPHIQVQIKHRLSEVLRRMKGSAQDVVPHLFEYLRGIYIIKNNLVMGVDMQISLLTNVFHYSIVRETGYDNVKKDSYRKFSISKRGAQKPFYVRTVYFKELEWLKSLKFGEAVDIKNYIDDIEKTMANIEFYMENMKSIVERSVDEEEKKEKLAGLSKYMLRHEALMKEKHALQNQFREKIKAIPVPYVVAEQQMYCKRIDGWCIRDACPELMGFYEPEEFNNDKDILD